MLLIFATPEEGRELLGLSTRPQKSGPCVHYGLYGCEVPRDDGQCPYLDNTRIVCPIKDALGAAQAYTPAEPESVEPQPDEAPVYTTPTRPKSRAPAHVKEWTTEEDAAIRDATTAAESVALYRIAVPDSERSDAAIRARWYKKVRPGLCDARDPLPDFVGDVAPVTQCDEDPVFAVPRPAYRPGDRVRITHALHRGQTGKIERYSPATENYLVAIDGMPDMVWLSEDYLEVV